MDNPLSKGSLEGRKLRAVVAMVRSIVAFCFVIVVLLDKTFH